MSNSRFTAACLLLLLACTPLAAQRRRKGQRILPPPAAISSPEPATPTSQIAGEIVGKRIVYADGATLDVDDTWKQGDMIWYRVHGTSQSTSRAVRTIENRYKEAPAPNNTAPKKPVEPKPAPVVTTWIYLVDGARLRVDEVREVSDGAWYNRDKVSVFLAKERIGRIERV